MSEAYEKHRDRMIAVIEAAFKTLLEEKHLYQSVLVDFEAILASAASVEAASSAEDEERRGLVAALREFATKRWICAHSGEYRYLHRRDDPFFKAYPFAIPPVRLYCARCKRREPFNVVKADDYLFEGMEKPPKSIEEQAREPRRPDDQAFVISLLCQGCQWLPEVVLVRRVAEKQRLILSGRAPMEQIELPAFIPTAEESLYRDALVAFHSGKTLAAAFYLRTFIEQVARRIARTEGRRTGDEIMDAYAATLPAELRTLMPSLREWYAKLSDDLHAAKGDEVLFRAARQQIDRHFDIRRVHGVDAPK